MRIYELQEELSNLKEDAKEAAAKKRYFNVKDMKLFAKSLEALEEFMQGRSGCIDRIFEEAIASPPINMQHNPYYAGSFNGKDFYGLVHNMAQFIKLILESMAGREGTSQEEKDAVKGLVDRHAPLWVC
jgi:hypothetical protein